MKALAARSSPMFSVPWLLAGRTPACPRPKVPKLRAAAAPQQVQTQDCSAGPLSPAGMEATRAFFSSSNTG